MTNQDEFFTPEDIDRQIQRVSRSQEGERADAEALAYLHSLYRTDTDQQTLDRLWRRIGPALSAEHHSQEHGKGLYRPGRPTQSGGRGRQHPRRNSLMQRRLGVLAAVVFLVVLVGSMVGVFYAARHPNGSPVPTPVISTPAPTPTPSPTPVPLKVTSVIMSVSPPSIAGITCGTNVTVTYTATFHMIPNGPGGTVQFNYTINNGRGQTTASLTFGPGETTKSYSFTWSGPLPADHTYPDLGGVEVTSPNSLKSPLVKPTGQCTPVSAFQVTQVDMTVSPSSIQGLACGTFLVVTYTATIHVAPNSPGGTVQFSYTVNNGRGQTMASLTFNAGETTKSYSFTWSGTLPADHTYPEQGGIQVTSPNPVTSSLVKPTGMCS